MRILICAVVVLFLAGCFRVRQEAAPVKVEFVIAETEPAPGLREVRNPDLGMTLYLHEEVLLTNEDIASSSVTRWEGRPVVEILFTGNGKEKFAKITGENLNRRIGILVDGKLVTAPIIRAEVPEGKAIVNGLFSEEEAERIAVGIVPR